VPATLSRVIVNVNDRVAGDNLSVGLYAGLVGVAQDADGALRPVAGWHLAPAPVEIDDVLDRILRDHVAAPPEPLPLLLSAPADAVALYRRIGSATLFGGAWRLLPAAEHRRIWREEEGRDIETFIDLADGRSISAAFDYLNESVHWVVCRVEAGDDGKSRLVDDASDVPVLGTSLAFLLDAALDSGGDLSHLATGRLADLEP
jgi:hypothetical protein